MSDIRDFVMQHPLFCHHDHQRSYVEFDADRQGYDFRSMLGYAPADLNTAAGIDAPPDPLAPDALAQMWPMIRVTGYGQAVSLGCQAIFGLDYTPDNWPAISEALQTMLSGQSAENIYDTFVHRQAQNVWTIQDGRLRIDKPSALQDGRYPASYRFAFRVDEFYSLVDAMPIQRLAQFTGRSIHTVSQLVDAVFAAWDLCTGTGQMAALKIGMAYQRDLTVGDPTLHEAEQAFARIMGRATFWDGIQQGSGAVDALSSRDLGDFILHRLVQRASDENLPVQIHTGYLAGNWGSLDGTRATLLIPLLQRYRHVRFDLFHASWPWNSELGAIAKNYPNVWLDMCWAWAMNPSASERALDEWLDAVPYNKIFAYGSDSSLPWLNVGYSLQAKLGIARVLEKKLASGFYSPATAREIATHIMLDNGSSFFGLHQGQ